MSKPTADALTAMHDALTARGYTNEASLRPGDWCSLTTYHWVTVSCTPDEEEPLQWADDRGVVGTGPESLIAYLDHGTMPY